MIENNQQYTVPLVSSRNAKSTPFTGFLMSLQFAVAVFSVMALSILSILSIGTGSIPT
jgi:hypothetical protein